MPTIINNSTFLDAYGAGQYTSQQYQTVAAATFCGGRSGPGGRQPGHHRPFPVRPDRLDLLRGAWLHAQVTVGLMLERAAPPSQLDPGR